MPFEITCPVCCGTGECWEDTPASVIDTEDPDEEFCWCCHGEKVISLGDAWFEREDL